MAISYPISLPSTPEFRSSRFGGVASVAVAQSPFTFQQQVYEHQGQMWRADMTLPPMQRATAEAWLAALLSLNGRRGTFLLGDPDATEPRGVATGSPVVSGSSQTGMTLVTAGWTTSTTGILKAGDYIQLGTGSSSRLYKVLVDADSDASGNATLDIWPRLRESPSSGATITVDDCKGLFRLSSNQFDWEVDEASIFGISFSAVEAI